MRILGVTFTSSLSLTLHVQSVIAACAQTLYALRVLRKHGLCDDSLHDIFRAVAVAKLMYASIGGSRIFLEGVTLGTRASEASEH